MDSGEVEGWTINPVHYCRPGIGVTGGPFHSPKHPGLGGQLHSHSVKQQNGKGLGTEPPRCPM